MVCTQSALFLQRSQFRIELPWLSKSPCAKFERSADLPKIKRIFKLSLAGYRDVALANVALMISLIRFGATQFDLYLKILNFCSERECLLCGPTKRIELLCSEQLPALLEADCWCQSCLQIKAAIVFPVYVIAAGRIVLIFGATIEWLQKTPKRLQKNV